MYCALVIENTSRRSPLPSAEQNWDSSACAVEYSRIGSQFAFSYLISHCSVMCLLCFCQTGLLRWCQNTLHVLPPWSCFVHIVVSVLCFPPIFTCWISYPVSKSTSSKGLQQDVNFPDSELSFSLVTFRCYLPCSVRCSHCDSWSVRPCT